MAREYVASKAHELRNGVVHASANELITLYGDLATIPGTEVTYKLEFPALLLKEPTLNVRFIPKSQIPQYIKDCQNGKFETPPNLDTYQAPDVQLAREKLRIRLTDDPTGRLKAQFQETFKIDKRKILVDMEHIEIKFITEPEEGAYVFVFGIDSSEDGVNQFDSVVVFSLKKSLYPHPKVEDLVEISICLVNISTKNGIMYFANPPFFYEHLGNIQLSDEVKLEMVNCSGLPPDLPANDDITVGLIRGNNFRGLRRVWIEADEEEDDACVCTNPVQVIKEEEKFEFSEFMKKL